MLDKLKNTTCPAPISDVDGQPLDIGITTQWLLTYISIPCIAITTIACLYLIFKHLHRYSRPAEQRQIVRLIWTPVVYSVFSLLGLLFYDAYEYIEPLPELYEAFALACLFVLFVHYGRNPTVRESGFTRSQTRNEFQSIADIKKTWIMVFQYPVVKTILIIAQEASTATGTYCAASNSIHFGHIWITLISNISLVACFLTIVRFYTANKHLMAVHKPLAKLLSFKLIVFVIFLQTLVFNFVPTPAGLSRNGTLSPRDVKYGLPSALVCLEMAAFAFFFHYSFRSRMYHPDERGHAGPCMSFAAACVDAANPSDLVMDIAQMFRPDQAGAGAAGGYVRTTEAEAESYRNSPSVHPLVTPQGAPARPVSPFDMPSAYEGGGGGGGAAQGGQQMRMHLSPPPPGY
ncbi:uncharacterized protein BKCO1_500068 [Diplodia corticola]|uniref:DUF300-domain-containing protein n=1 Tax=Diplodia corticola TaxID=236234 RepID=A0A1J9RZM0_9PEZI|nr:uncharacterized protein BKCO1_500068 [Diplodia corticola]OJD38123.1 hypothetical protein BKCO1_500068 [Diplodia corticola]